MEEPEQPSLRSAGRKLWASIVESYELNPAELEILRQACATADLVYCIELELEDAAMTVLGSTGQARPNPLLASVADQRRTLDQLLRSLALPVSGEVEGSRRSPQQQAAAQARWSRQKGGGSGTVADEAV